MATCKTCTNQIPDSSNFCPICGAKQVKSRLTIWTLLKNLIVTIGNLDFPFYKTSRWLLVKPDLVTIGYINGVRKVINTPIQYALIVLSLYGLFQFLFADFLDLSIEQNFLSGFQAGFNNYESSNNESYESMDAIINWIQSRNQFFLFSMIPSMGVFSALLYRNSN